MGDRANIVMKFSDGAVFFYGHWSGADFVRAAKRALAKQERWSDPPYLARIVWDEFSGKDRGTTGFGISLGLCDNEHDLCVIDTEAQRVIRAAAGTPIGAEKGSWPFAEFIKFDDSALDW